MDDVESLMAHVSDTAKDLYGVRLPYGHLTLEELKEEADRLSAELERQVKEEWAEEEALCVQFNCTREDLRRWDVI